MEAWRRHCRTTAGRLLGGQVELVGFHPRLGETADTLASSGLFGGDSGDGRGGLASRREAHDAGGGGSEKGRSGILVFFLPPELACIDLVFLHSDVVVVFIISYPAGSPWLFAGCAATTERGCTSYAAWE